MDYGRASLACDIEEVFRPGIDRFVCEMFLEGEFTKMDFVQEGKGIYLSKKSRARFYPLYEEHIGPLRSEMRDFIRALVEAIKDEKEPIPDRCEGPQD